MKWRQPKNNDSLSTGYTSDLQTEDSLKAALNENTRAALEKVFFCGGRTLFRALFGQQNRRMPILPQTDRWGSRPYAPG